MMREYLRFEGRTVEKNKRALAAVIM